MADSRFSISNSLWRSVALTISGIALFGLLWTASDREGRRPRLIESAQAGPSTPDVARDDPIRRLLSEDPLEFLKQARRDYDRKVSDYTCTFHKQEFIGGRLSPVQEVDVKFREGPFSVFMHITRNPGKARRVLFVENALVKDGEQLAVIEPEGPLARLFVRSVERSIDADEFRKASRRAINEFGFARSLGLIIRYAEMTRARGIIDLRYVGEGSVDGRPTYILERRLPRDGLGTIYPDVLLVAHIDQEWLVPVSCTSYADLQGTQLLGRYVYTGVDFNVGLTAVDFDRITYGL